MSAMYRQNLTEAPTVRQILFVLSEQMFDWRLQE